MNKNYEYNKLCPFKWFILQNFPFLDYDFDQITNWQLFQKLGEKINDVINSQNLVGEELEQLVSAFNSLKDYVDNYFENLDVQDEINNKLDEMAESGDLTNILLNYANVERVYNTTVDMINDYTNLSNGMKIKTLGYYNINDGGECCFYITNTQPNSNTLYIELTNLYAVLILKNNTVNVKQMGAYGDEIHDDYNVLDKIFKSNYDVFIPKGRYLITQGLIMKFNKKIIGENRKGTVIIGNFADDFIISYGESYNYNAYGGEIKNLSFTTSQNINNKPRGIKLYSGCLLENLDFVSIGQVIARPTNYIDLITIKNIYLGYCIPNGEYLINLNGNQDALIIDQLKFAHYSDDDTVYNGIYIGNCHGGSIDNSIINGNITINLCNAFSINNTHCEGRYQFRIVDSEVTFNNCFKFKNINNNDIVLSSSNYDRLTTVELNNFSFYTIGSLYDFNYMEDEIDELTANTILKLNKCYRQFNFADKNRSTFFGNGIKIKNNTDFNYNSSYLSNNCLIINNKIKSDIKYNDGVFTASGLGTISKSNIAKWKGINTNVLHYRAIIIIDEERKLISGLSSDGNVTDIDTNTIPIIALNINYAKNILLLRGSEINNYTSKCLIPANTRCLLLDNFYSVNGYPWENTEITSIANTYNTISKYEKYGNNVIVEKNGLPSYGIWQQGDKVINTNTTTGQAISWIYDGTNWISQGTY